MGSGDVQDSATMIGMRARQRSPIMLASKKRSHPGGIPCKDKRRQRGYADPISRPSLTAAAVYRRGYANQHLGEKGADQRLAARAPSPPNQPDFGPDNLSFSALPLPPPNPGADSQWL